MVNNLDSTIQSIQEELKNDYEWNQTINKLSRYNLTNSVFDAQKCVEFFAYHYDSETKFQTQISLEVWERLVLLIGDVLKIFDKTGVSEYILKYQDEIIRNKFTETTNFKNFEERMLSNLEIPEKAWKKFWSITEESKMQMNEVLYDKKQIRLSDIWNKKYQINRGPGKVKPLSPFKWGRAVATGISSTLLVANGVLMLTSGAFGIASVMAPIVALSYFAGQNSD